MGGRFDERYSGTLNPGQTLVDIPVEVRQSFLDAQINQNKGDQQISFELVNSAGSVVAVANKQKIQLDGLPLGSYKYRVRGSVAKPVDFTIKSGQGK
jgi:hypothetical protein